MWAGLRQELRRMARRPGEILLAVLVLAAGLGSTLFVLGAINAFLLRPLPFPQAQELVQIGLREPGARSFEGVAARDFLGIDGASGSLSFDDLAAVAQGTINLADQGGPERYEGAFVSHDMFALLRVAPTMGRQFLPADDQVDAPLAVLLSDAVWRNRYHADPNVVGRQLRVNAQPATVIGVMPADFAFPARAAVWVPLRAGRNEVREQGLTVNVVARVAGETQLERLREQLARRLADSSADQPERYRGRELATRPLAQMFVSAQTRGYMWLMFAAALCVLLVACANVANLLLSQVSRRGREIAVRRTLGAGRTRLIAQVLTECLLLSLVACALAVIGARVAGQWVMDAFTAAGDGAAWYIRLELDMFYVLSAVGFVVLSSLLAGLLPAWRASSPAASSHLRSTSRGGADGGFARFSRALVVAEIAICCVLLIGAGASVRSLRALASADWGGSSAPTQVLTGRIGLFPSAYPTGAAQLALFERVAERIRQEPGVLAATAASTLPGSLAGLQFVQAFGAAVPEGSHPLVESGVVDDGFAATYGIALRAGRFFDARDQSATQPVVIIDADLAQQLFPGRDPLGQQLKLDPDEPGNPWRTVVGVVPPLQLADSHQGTRPALLLPMRQSPVRFASIGVLLGAGTEPLAFAPRLAELVREIDPDTPVYWLRSHARAIEMERIGPTVLAHIFGGFGVIGLLLAGVGLYSVLAFNVNQRTHEIGLRRAIGASAAQIVRAVTLRSGWQLGLGLLIGMLLGIPWAITLSRQDLGVTAIDPWVFGSVLLTLTVAGLLASLLPARRALAVPPLEALRHE